MDPLFYTLQFCKIAGAFRGNGDFLLDMLRPESSIKTARKVTHGREHCCGINGDVVVFKPSQEETKGLLSGLKTYRPPRVSGGEQDYISEYFGLQRSLGQVDLR